MRGLIGKTIENGFDFSAVPSGKGKLEKISIRMSSICDRKGAREDIHQDVFDMRPQGSTRRYPSGCLRYATAREHEKISIRISSIYIAPATMAQRRYFRYLLVFAISHERRKSPFAIAVETSFSIISFYQCLIKDFQRAIFLYPEIHSRPCSSVIFNGTPGR
jgi:hypothetical protein